MRTWTRAVPAAMGALALAVVLSGCNGTDSAKDGKGSGSSDDKKTYRLGEASPAQESTMKESKGSTFTVTPTKVATGTKADMDNSGLDKDKDKSPKIPVYVWATVTHKSGKAMEVGDMDDDLVVKTDKGERTKALIVIMGEAKWPDCPAPDSLKKLTAGQSEKICKAFLIPEGQKAAAVQLSQGFYDEPLEWPAAG
ncbi:MULTISPECIES: hypothetical protein [unclassified Streptomyces]|uniref:hypothetical protein n=1 Tax=unclassified Streptomyces TaxID=2593676 RepID=UPI00224E02C8|nr:MULTISPECIES: hypothetical protein [unclassified Streptomyces]MCX5144830.1 hypothetical protein [Streptomyces sp. NBC_00338]WRZ62908.1 hypothetical protein OG408_03040 [Streptomyces sp. NBC_01257]WSU56876.1 hypothetical protein OG450_03000 [Streptomyces sp. NBC_01104]